MKFLTVQIAYLLSNDQSRQNIKALGKYLLFLAAVITLFTIGFHTIMLSVEGRDFSWVTGLYWTLTVMTTLGFGDITFNSDIGRLFSVVVLLSGVVLLLIVLPFAFIRYFYAPWLEAQLHHETPRSVPADTVGHVIICGYETIAPNLIKRLNQAGMEYFVIEPDPVVASRLTRKGISTISGRADSRQTYERMNAEKAALIFANLEDTTNTNIILTIRESAPDVPIAAIASEEDSIDIMELSGATNVLPLKHRLGEHLANRISVGEKRAHEIGKFGNWRVVEFTVHRTKLSGKKIRDTRIREKTGANIIGVWERGHLLPANPEAVLSDFSVPLGVGTPAQIEKLEQMLKTDKPEPKSVLILGGGKVGRAAAEALRKQGITVNMVERDASRINNSGCSPDRLIIGDAADRETLLKAGLMESSLAILSTNDDAVNIYLSIYCRKLNPNLRIISRITHDINLESIHRAGADFVLGYAPLGAESVMALLQGREPVIMGEGVDFFTVNVPAELVGKTLIESEIGSHTGLVVLDIELGEEVIANPPPDMKLPKGSRLNVLGTAEQMQTFRNLFE